MVVVLAWVVGVAIVLPVDVAQMAAIYILIMEGISILENLDQAGINIPILKKILKKAQDSIDPADKEE